MQYLKKYVTNITTRIIVYWNNNESTINSLIHNDNVWNSGDRKNG